MTDTMKRTVASSGIVIDLLMLIGNGYVGSKEGPAQKNRTQDLRED
jgi:hypothetical protein